MSGVDSWLCFMSGKSDLRAQISCATMRQLSQQGCFMRQSGASARISLASMALLLSCEAKALFREVPKLSLNSYQDLLGQHAPLPLGCLTGFEPAKPRITTWYLMPSGFRHSGR